MTESSKRAYRWQVREQPPYMACHTVEESPNKVLIQSVSDIPDGAINA